ncbi:MAG: hypothetical protein KDC95_19400 [Planctomycetes bacterium]|nr:hypothetical protein [Planctomycetota bacterium]
MKTRRTRIVTALALGALATALESCSSNSTAAILAGREVDRLEHRSLFLDTAAGETARPTRFLDTLKLLGEREADRTRTLFHR